MMTTLPVPAVTLAPFTTDVPFAKKPSLPMTSSPSISLNISHITLVPLAWIFSSPVVPNCVPSVRTPISIFVQTHPVSLLLVLLPKPPQPASQPSAVLRPEVAPDETLDIYKLKNNHLYSLLTRLLLIRLFCTF